MPFETQLPPTWARRRKLSAMVFGYYIFLYGSEYGILVSSLWIYIKTLIKTDHPLELYSGVLVSYAISSAIIATIVCKAADKYRNIRTIFFILTTLKIIGNMLYVVHFSPWIVLVSRLISGMGCPFRSVISGEVARCYAKEEISSMFSLMGLSRCAGFMVVPVINSLFTSVDIYVLSIHITFANIAGIYLSILFIIGQIMTFFLMHNLSKEYNLKCINDEEGESADEMFPPGEDNPLLKDSTNNVSIWWVTKEILLHVDTC